MNGKNYLGMCTIKYSESVKTIFYTIEMYLQLNIQIPDLDFCAQTLQM